MTRYVKDGDLLSGAVLAVLAAYIIHASSQWTLLGPEGPGPGFFPLGYGVLMLGCSLALIVAALVRRAPDETPAEAAQPAGTIDALVTWGALAASVPLMWALGFVVGFGLVIFFIVRFVFRRTLIGSAATAAGVVLALHLVFPVLLGSPLPVALWWGF